MDSFGEQVIFGAYFPEFWCGLVDMGFGPGDFY